MIRGQEIPLEAVREQPAHTQQCPPKCDSEVIKIKIFAAFESKNRLLENYVLDKYFMSLGVDIVIPTQSDTGTRKTSTQTDTKWSKKQMEMESWSILVSGFSFLGHHFRIKYHGQLRFCRKC